MSEVVTLVEVFDRLEAEIIKEALEAIGIEAVLFQESAGALYPTTFGALGKVEICVPAEQIEQANAWLDEYNANSIAPEVVLDNEFEEESDEPEQE